MARGTYDRADGSKGDYACNEWSTGAPCDAASVNTFGAYVVSSMKVLLKPPHGAFLVSCFQHCRVATDVIAANATWPLSPLAAFQVWFERGAAALPGGDGVVADRHTFPCAECCQPGTGAAYAANVSAHTMVEDELGNGVGEV